jgi:hypothetical protein
MSDTQATGEPPIDGVFITRVFVVPYPWTPYDAPTPESQYGYNCIFCGAFIPWGSMHICAPSMPPMPPRPLPPPAKEKKPFVCPKCHGDGQLGDFNCKPCGGTGIVWG